MAADIKILVVDDEANHARATAEIVERMGHPVTVATSGVNGIRTIAAQPFDVVITDLAMGDVDGFEVLRAARAANPACFVVVVTGEGTVEDAVEAVKLGAAHYLTKPVKVEQIRNLVRDAVRDIRDRRTSGDDAPIRVVAERVSDVEPDEFIEFIGNSPQLDRVFEVIRKVAPTPATVLITGENGTGKELVARAIHRLSPRRDQPFVALNCGALSEQVLESELFGHVRGAFTGATSSREGRFEFADKGTLFLDEIGDTSLAFQVKLLRVIQEREIVPVGANAPKRVDVRIIAATNRDLVEGVKRGIFREDLYYRLKVVHVAMPPLRDRREDVPPLVRHFIREANLVFGRSVQGIEPAALQQLVNHDWPGNVRQLKNVVETMVLLSSGPMLGPQDIPEDVTGIAHAHHALAPLEIFEQLTLSGIEEFMIRHHLRRYDGNRARVAEALGISERTLYRKLKEYGLSQPALPPATDRKP